MFVMLMFSSCYKHDFGCNCGGAIVDIKQNTIIQAKSKCREISPDCKTGAFVY